MRRPRGLQVGDKTQNRRSHLLTEGMVLAFELNTELLARDCQCDFDVPCHYGAVGLGSPRLG
jgi:hypothetical protein